MFLRTVRGGGTWPFVGSLQLMTCAVPVSIVKWDERGGRKRDIGATLENMVFYVARMYEAGLMEYRQVAVRDELTTRSKGTRDQSIHTSARTPLHLHYAASSLLIGWRE